MKKAKAPGIRPRGQGLFRPQDWHSPEACGLTTDSYESTFTTTRRFMARPSRVLFGATGFSSP